MFAKTMSLGLMGIDAFPVTVEVDHHRGMPAFEIVGLPDAAVKEARDRVKAAMGNCGLELRPGRVVVNLAPADLRKGGTLYDLPILIGLLGALGELPGSFEGLAFLGELSLSGEVRPVPGILPMVLKAKEQGLRGVYLPAANAREGSIAGGIDIYPVQSVMQLLDHFAGRKPIEPAPPLELSQAPAQLLPDFKDVKGQAMARRAAEIAAAGGHNLLMIGTPGSGKSMIAKRIPSILPPPSFAEAIEITKVHSVAGLLPPDTPLLRTRPFRAPHHTVSPAGLSGGGPIPRPGEVSLAHGGVLFLDELPEFSRAAMEVLRQPIEDGAVTISRANARLRYPSTIMLVAAMNPCPCGYYGHPAKECICGEKKIDSYIGRVSGPLLDRIDLHVEVMPVEFDTLSAGAESECSADIRARVIAARERQLARREWTGADCNAHLAPGMVREVCQMSGEAREVLRRAFERMGLSARAYDRILKVSRTIADLDGSEKIERRHVAEAVQYRSLDRKYWRRNRD